MRRFVLSFLLGLALVSCAEKNRETVPTIPEEQKFEHVRAVTYTTTVNKKQLLDRTTVNFKAPDLPLDCVVRLDSTRKYQEMVGFGPAMTGSTCYNLLQMSVEDRSAIMHELFDPEEGYGISLVRVSIGSSDFSVNKDFTWCDEKGIEHFAIPEEDELYLLPILHEAYRINPDLQIIASPWTPPLWMKRMSNKDDSDFVYSGDTKVSPWAGGSLKPSCYQDYATYFVKWIEFMENEGFSIYGITIQNEPYHKGNTASCYMDAYEQRSFIKEALGPAFATAGLRTKIICYDHNYDGYRFPQVVYDDPDASRYVAGSAWHNYGGKVDMVDNVIASSPEKEIYFTEASIGSWNHGGSMLGEFGSIFMDMMERGCKGITLWNLALDEKNGPYRHHGCSTCYGVITISSTDHKVVERNSHYYDIVHASKVVRPGAVRIGTSGPEFKGIRYMAFQNPDGSFAVLVMNSSISEQDTRMVFDDGNRSVDCSIPPFSLVSITW